MGYSRLVLAVALQRFLDFTPIALRSREVALALAKYHRAHVEVLTVEAPVALLPGAETTQEKLERFVNPLREAGVDPVARLLRGKPSGQIAHFAAQVRADLLILGSHSKRGPWDVGLGSTSSALMKEPPCPVLMVCATKEEAERAQELMIPGYPFIFPYG